MSNFLNTLIPTSARGAIRSYLKSRPEWDAFCVNKGIESRAATKAQILEFADQYGYQADVLTLINNGIAMPALTAFAPSHKMSDSDKKAIAGLTADAEREFNMQEDARIETEQAAYEAAKEVYVAGGSHAEARAASLAVVTKDMVKAAEEEFFHLEWAAEITRVEDLLAPVDAFLSPLVKAKLTEALVPLVEKANKGPVTVEKVIEVEVIKEIVREVQAARTAPEGSMPYAVKGNKVMLGKLFGFKGKHADKQVHLWESHGAAPSIDPYYVVDPFNMAMAATAFDRGENVWLVGPGGSGKTTLPQQFCAYTNRPFVKINFTRNSHVDDFVGGQGVKQGNSGWEDGVLIEAMKRPGTVILLDEISLAPAGVQGLFQGAADEHRTYTLPTGEKVTAAPGVVFCVADNTNGQGDDTGLYQGTNQCNGALVNRFARMIKVSYMSVEVEAAALHQHNKAAPLAACTYLAEFVARARGLPSMENAILSLRNMSAFIRVVLDGFSIKEAAEVTILNQMVANDRAALETLFTLVWAKEFENLLAGNAPAQATVSFPADGGAFDDAVTDFLNR